MTTTSEHELVFDVIPEAGKTRVHAVCARCGSDYAGAFAGPRDSAEAAGREDAAQEFSGLPCNPMDLGVRA